MEEKNLEKILNQLGLGGRIFAVKSLVGKVNLAEHHVNEAIEYYEKEERFEDAAYIAVKAGKREKAKELLGKVYKNYLEKLKMASSYAFSAEYFVNSAKNFIELALEFGMVDEVINFYEKANKLEKAADLAYKNNKREKAADLYKKIIENYAGLGNFKKAAEIAYKAGWPEKAKDLEYLSNLINEKNKKY